jgi:hypothetical protein
MERSQPLRWGYVLALVLVAATAAAAVPAARHALGTLHRAGHLQRFLGPAGHEVHVQQAGNVDVFLETRSVWAGTAYTVPGDAAEWRVRVYDARGESVVLTTTGIDTSYQTGSHEGTRIGHFHASRAGTYRISVDRVSKLSPAHAVFAVGNLGIFAVVVAVAELVVILLAGIALAACVAIATAVGRRRYRADRRGSRATPPPRDGVGVGTR